VIATISRGARAAVTDRGELDFPLGQAARAAAQRPAACSMTSGDAPVRSSVLNSSALPQAVAASSICEALQRERRRC